MRPLARLLLRRTSLGGKLVLILTAVGAGGALAITVLLAIVITPSFAHLETRVAEAYVERALAPALPPTLIGARQAAAAARAAVAEDVEALGRRMLLLAIAGSTLLLLLVLMVLRRMIARLVLAPLARVEAHMQRVSGSGALSPLEDDGRPDEIGSLGRSFNAMLSQLADLRGQIEAQSFALGRSESAVAVMHNVRNALNPISTILTQGLVQPAPVDRAMLDRALAELARGDVTADRRAKLAAFVAAALEAEALARDQVRGELTVGREAMAHVLEIIGDQQRRAHERPPLDPCDVVDLVARNAAIARYAADATIAVEVPAGVVPAMANRVILSQVIGNLLGNAAEAIVATGRGSGTIAVSVTRSDGRVRLSLRDDGEGFDMAQGMMVFQRGFSTRAGKSGGLGLHWCANAMTAMGGRLDLRSAGRGRGAEAVLTLDAAGVLAKAA